MTIVTRKDRVGASRAKLATVGVLAAVLVAVIVAQLPESAESDNAPTASVTDMPGWEGEQTVANSVSNPPAPNMGPKVKAPREWPKLTREEIVERDPLAAPSWYLAALGTEEANEQAGAASTATAVEAESTVLAELQKTGATIVLIANGQRIATIGDRQIRVGDRIEGYQVSDITDEGVILTKSRVR